MKLHTITIAATVPSRPTSRSPITAAHTKRSNHPSRILPHRLTASPIAPSTSSPYIPYLLSADYIHRNKAP
ncbi:uncharacterized protein CLUP02_02801 [Colletotrichum lupini]|uniref:Uncharacterized protein n=1 Tax=Colletotrichum lupini TaxID=145971 RepID=A0A9Q8WB61_9PEZI|nr:uncharacterized protein CLUP02_02801 [Colletotrichum lupini]UQC77333.1 hypothetical protein CLUP02_02801 [Colletotrichum lupini]